MKLVLVRHGETKWNREGRVQGADSDIELNDIGLEQARRLGGFLSCENVIAVYASPMQRAVATAQAIAEHHSVSVEADEGLKEIMVGELEGISISNLRSTFSQFLKQWWEERGAIEAASGETFVELQQRVWKVVERLLERHQTDCGHDNSGVVVIVSHFFVTLAIIFKALDLPADCFTRFRVDLGGVSVLEVNEHGVRLLTFNDNTY